MIACNNRLDLSFPPLGVAIGSIRYAKLITIMAEVVGIVAGGISIGTLATQISSNLIKLKSYWDQVQDVPEDIRDLVEKLEILSQMLVDIEDYQRQRPTPSFLIDTNTQSRCVQHCQKAAVRLREFIISLKVDTEGKGKIKQKFASAKILLKKDTISRYRAELNSTIILLSLSLQLYERLLPILPL